MRLLISLLLNTATVAIAAYVLPGVAVADAMSAFVVAIILGIVNTFLKPILVVLTLPITVVTLGLFLFVINAAMVLLVARIVPGFVVDGFWWALLFSFVVSIVGGFLGSMADEEPVKM